MKTTKANQISGNGENYIMPADWELAIPVNSEICVVNNSPIKNNKLIKQLNRYRMIILFDEMNDIPDDVLNYGASYAIQYQWFNRTVKYNLDFSKAQLQPKGVDIPLKRLNLFYFFSHNSQGIEQLINQFETLNVVLLRDRQRLGSLDCELNDFRSERVVKRDFYKQFSGKQIRSVLSWRVNLSIGIVNDGPVDVD